MIDSETRNTVTGIFSGIALGLVLWPVLYFLIIAWL